MKRTIWLSRALQTWILLICTLIIIGIFPLRLFRKTLTIGETSSPRFVSEAVSDFHSIRQYFIASYDKIDSVSVYVSGVEGGRYLGLALQKNGYSSVCSRYVDLQNENIPGYVTVKLGVDLEPGEIYNFLLTGRFSSLRTAQVSFDPATVPEMGSYQYDRQPVSGMRLACSLTYDLPLSKQTSLIYIGMILAAAVLLCVLIDATFRKKKAFDKLLMVGDVIFYPLAVLLTLGYGALFILNFPLRAFESDPLEITYYAVGITIAAVMSLYALYRICRDDRRSDALIGREWLTAILMALALKYACDYMNGTYNLAHYIAARQMITCLLLMALTLFPVSVLLSPMSLLVVAGTAVAAVLWARGQMLLPEEELAELYNLEITLTAVIAVMVAYVLMSLIVQQVRIVRRKVLPLTKGTAVEGKKRIPLYLLLTILTGIVLIVFRNTRIWIPVLVALYAFIYASARQKAYEARWFLIVQKGVLIHFLASLCYCLLHRAFQCLVFNRFGFVFSTATITAQYMTMVCSMAAAALINRLRESFEEGKNIRGALHSAWSELMFFGIVISYMLFTISRLSTVAVICMLLFLIMVTIIGRHPGKKMIITAVVSFVCMTVIFFPAAFTMQRTIPSLYEDIELLPDVEEVAGEPFYDSYLGTPPFLLGKSGPDNAGYIRIRRFFHVFIYRFFDTEEIIDWYRFDKYNFDKNQFLEYGFNGEELPLEYLEQKHQAALEAAGGSVSVSDEESADEAGTASTVTEDVSATDVNHLEQTSEATTEDVSSAKPTDNAETAVGTEEQPEAPVADEGADTEENAESTPDYNVSAQGEGTDVSNGRFEIWKSYLENVDLEGHPEMDNELTVGGHAHNIYLQVAFDCGIPAGILFFVWIGLTMIGALIAYLKNVGKDTPFAGKIAASSLFSMALLTGFAVAGLFDWNFHLANPSTLIFMMGIAPLVVCSGKR